MYVAKDKDVVYHQPSTIIYIINDFLVLILSCFCFIAYSSWSRSYGNGGGTRHSKYFQCNGSELRLSKCDSSIEILSKFQSSDLGVVCRQG